MRIAVIFCVYIIYDVAHAIWQNMMWLTTFFKDEASWRHGMQKDRAQKLKLTSRISVRTRGPENPSEYRQSEAKCLG